jgi:ABC-type transporter Mla subunit MlaD
MADNTDNIKDVQNSERLLDLSNQIVDSLNQRRKLIKDIKEDENLYFTTVKQQQRLSQDIAANAEKYLGYQIKSKDLVKQIKASWISTRSM